MPALPALLSLHCLSPCLLITSCFFSALYTYPNHMKTSIA